MIEPKLYIIVYDRYDAEPEWFHTVAVDMDEATANLLVIKHQKSMVEDYDDKRDDDEPEPTLEDFDVTNVWCETVHVEGFDITITEKEATQ